MWAHRGGNGKDALLTLAVPIGASIPGFLPDPEPGAEGLWGLGRGRGRGLELWELGPWGKGQGLCTRGRQEKEKMGWRKTEVRDSGQDRGSQDSWGGLERKG